MMISQMLKNRKSFGETWNESVDHSWDTKWLKDLQSEVNVTKQKKVDTNNAKLEVTRSRFSPRVLVKKF